MYKEMAVYKWKSKVARNMSPCGKGSTPKATKPIREFIEKMISKYDIESITDAGCGDFSWMSQVDKQGASYIGYDINLEMLLEVRENYPENTFIHCDITEHEFPKTDLIICRDCMFHLDLETSYKAFLNLKKSGSKYIMCPTFTWSENNKKADDDSKGGYSARRYNMNLIPFDLGEFIEYVSEPTQKKRTFGMWRLND